MQDEDENMTQPNDSVASSSLHSMLDQPPSGSLLPPTPTTLPLLNDLPGKQQLEPTDASETAHGISNDTIETRAVLDSNMTAKAPPPLDQADLLSTLGSQPLLPTSMIPAAQELVVQPIPEAPTPLIEAVVTQPMISSETGIADTQDDFEIMASGQVPAATAVEEAPTPISTTQSSATAETLSTAATTEADTSTTQSSNQPKLPETPWQEILIDMLADLGFTESSRILSAEELVLSTTQRERAPGVIEKYVKLLQGSTAGSRSSAGSEVIVASGSTKRHNTGFSDTEARLSDEVDLIKRRRVDPIDSAVQVEASREEIEDRMAQFMALKREQINESNRQEFIKGRAVPQGGMHGLVTPESSTVEDDGCARVDARKLNRTIQMKLETVKNEALTKTNPKSRTPANDLNQVGTGMDERLRNIQVHLNLRFAAMPTCTIAERIKIIEDVIIQLERDYPLWSALHFNQPNRVFPPPPAVTTVSRNTRNQIVMTGEHLMTTLIDSGDPSINLSAIPGSTGNLTSVSMPRAHSGGQSGSTPSIHGHGMSVSDRTKVPAGRISSDDMGNSAGAQGGLAKTGVANATGTGASPTVIKLKRHGGAGSSSLARAVQQQLAQRKAAGGSLYSMDDTKRGLAPHTMGQTPIFKISPTPGSSSGLKPGTDASHVHLGTLANLGSSPRYSPGSSPGSSLSPTMGFPDPLKPGVTGRGPIKSRRKSIAKGLDPASAMASMSVAHTGNILGSSPDSLLSGSSLGTIPSTVPSANISALLSQANVLGTTIAHTSSATPKPRPTPAKKPRKKKGETGADGEDDGTQVKPALKPGAGRGKGGFGLGKGKSGGRPTMGLGLGKGKGGAYREELLRRAEVEDFDEDDGDEDDFQVDSQSAALNNGRVSLGINTAQTATAAPSGSAAVADGQKQTNQPLKPKKRPIKPTPKQAPVRKFGGKSFGMAGGESSGSSGSESSDGGSGSSGSQSDSSSSGSISGSDAADFSD